MNFSRSLRHTLLSVSALVALMAGANAPCMAQSLYTVTLDTTGLSGLSGQLAFDLVDGDGVINNTGTVSAFASDATLLGAGNANVGGASGDLPGNLALADTAFFNESARALVFGNTVSFTLDLSSNLAAPGSPDEFSFFLLDAAGTGSLVSTSDPTGADSLFTIDLDGTSAGTLTLFAPGTPGVSYTAAFTPVPEPGTLALLAGIGFSGVGFLARRACRKAV